eukprot:COSAG05_NODE_5305_length_1210_cov_12.464477_2_plen_363_part_01
MQTGDGATPPVRQPPNGLHRPCASCKVDTPREGYNINQWRNRGTKALCLACTKAKSERGRRRRHGGQVKGAQYAQGKPAGEVTKLAHVENASTTTTLGDGRPPRPPDRAGWNVAWSLTHQGWYWWNDKLQTTWEDPGHGRFTIVPSRPVPAPLATIAHHQSHHTTAGSFQLSAAEQTPSGAGTSANPLPFIDKPASASLPAQTATSHPSAKRKRARKKGTSTRSWTVAEEAKLMEIVRQDGSGQWANKAAQLCTGRSGTSVQQRYRQISISGEDAHGADNELVVRAQNGKVSSVFARDAKRSGKSAAAQAPSPWEQLPQAGLSAASGAVNRNRSIDHTHGTAAATQQQAAEKPAVAAAAAAAA